MVTQMNKKILLPVIAVVVIGAAALVWFLVINKDTGPAPVVYANYSASEAIVTNVKKTSESKTNRLLKTGVCVVMDEILYKEITASKEIEAYYQPIIKDTIIFILRELTEDDINDTTGQDKIRQKLTDALNERLDLNGMDADGNPKPKIYSIIFTDFVMQ